MNKIMLIVDDSKVNREILRVLFAETYEIMEAENGEDALEILKVCQGKVDIVLLDLLMPKLSGIELMHQRKQLDYFKDVPVVVITSSSYAEDQIEVFNLGASDFITKPFIPEIVVSRVNNVIAAQSRMLNVVKEAESLKIKSEMDGMTGLLNKPSTEAYINEQLKDFPYELHALLIIDIDNFKTVNDTSGHQAGDQVLKIVSKLIASHFRKSDILGRIGGDEFCVLMSNVPSMDIVREKVHELVQIMRYKPNITVPEYVTLSIGVAVTEGKPITYEQLFAKADAALYTAKENGKAQFFEYGQEKAAMDSRQTIALLTPNRSVSSMVNSAVTAKVKVVEALSLAELRAIWRNAEPKPCLLCVDISNGDATEAFWEELAAIPGVCMQQVLAICEESKTEQYADAVKHQVRDLVTTPIETVSFKRRLTKYLQSLENK